MGSCGMCFKCHKIIIADWWTGKYPNEILLCNECSQEMEELIKHIDLSNKIRFNTTKG